LKNWLTQEIYTHGRKYEPAELIQRVTGRPLEVEPYLAYLRTKFGALYGVTL
jgi:carboxypeptidase Taq